MKASFAAALLGLAIAFAAPGAQAMPAAPATSQDQAAPGAAFVEVDHKHKRFRDRDFRRWERRADRHFRRHRDRGFRHRGFARRDFRHRDFRHRDFRHRHRHRHRDFGHRDFRYRDFRDRGFGHGFHRGHRHGRDKNDDDALYIIGGVLGTAILLGLIVGY